MDPEPAMSVHPSAADIARYNAWADRNGRQRFGPAAPEPPAAPPARRPGRPGLPRPALPNHGVVSDEPGGGWIRGTHVRGRQTVAYQTNGQLRIISTFNSRTGETQISKKGQEYYKNNRQKFIINVPAIAYIVPRGGGQLQPAMSGDGKFRRIIPLTDDMVHLFTGEGAEIEPQFLQLTAAGLAPDREHDRSTVEQALTIATEEYLQSLPTVATSDGNKHTGKQYDLGLGRE